jgi:NADH-quinone oxidoreductase subunit M
LSLIAVIYIGLVALVQKDMKKLVAYSSIAHMGFVTLGFFMFNPMSVQGGIVQMISHGFISGAMFLCIGVLYDRMHSRQIADYGGVVNLMPKFAALLRAVLDGQLRPACDLRLRRRVHGHPGRGAVQLLDRHAGRHRPDLRRGVLAVDGQARDLRRVANKHVAELTDLNKREFFMLGVLAHRRDRNGPVPGAVHRYDANLGGRPAQARRRVQAAPINQNESND